MEEHKHYKQMHFGVKSDGTTEMMGRDSDDEPWKLITTIKPTVEKVKVKKESFWKKLLTVFIS